MIEDKVLQGLRNELAGLKMQDKENTREQEIAEKIQLIYACPYQTAKKLTPVRPRLARGRRDWEIGDPDSALILRKLAALKKEICRTGLLFPYADETCFTWPWFKGTWYHPEDPRGRAILRVKELNQVTLDEEHNFEEFEEKYGRKPRRFFKNGMLDFSPFYREEKAREKFLQEMVDEGYVSWKPKEPFGAPAWGYPLESSYFSFQLMEAVELEKGAQRTIRIRPRQGFTTVEAQEFQDVLIRNDCMNTGADLSAIMTKRTSDRGMGIRFSSETPFSRFDWAHIFPAMHYSDEKRSYEEIHRDWIDRVSEGRFGEKSIPTQVPEKYKSICYKHRNSRAFPVVYGL